MYRVVLFYHQEIQRTTLLLWRKQSPLCVLESRPYTTLSTWPFRHSSRFCHVYILHWFLWCYWKSLSWCLSLYEGICLDIRAGRSSSCSAAWLHVTQPTYVSWLRWSWTLNPAFTTYFTFHFLSEFNRVCPVRPWRLSRCGCLWLACQLRSGCAQSWPERREARTASSWMRVTSRSCWCCMSNLLQPALHLNAL